MRVISFVIRTQDLFRESYTKTARIHKLKCLWKTVKPFLTKKGCITNDCIKIEKDGDTLRDEKVLVELFNENYVDIVETSSGNKPSSLRNCEDSAQDDATADKIISKYSSHPSVQKNKTEFTVDKELELAYASA